MHSRPEIERELQFFPVSLRSRPKRGRGRGRGRGARTREKMGDRDATKTPILSSPPTDFQVVRPVQICEV